MVTHISHNPDDTEALGEAWGRAAQKGLVLALSGDLGAGKTQLVRGLARGLGSPARVHSPTFSLVNIYSGGRLTLFHLDLYRLETSDQIASAGLEEYLTPDGITAIEWAERWFGSPFAQVPVAIGSPTGPLNQINFFRWARLTTVSETERRIDYEDTGA